MNRKRAFVAALLLTLAALGAGGCGADDCSRAGDRLEQCLVNNEASSDAYSGNYKCEKLNLCTAQCISEASCDELVDAYPGGMQSDKSRKFLTCVADCHAKNGG